MSLKKILKDPSLIRGKRVDRKDTTVTVGDYTFECSSVEVAKKVWARIACAQFGHGMTTRGSAQSREAIAGSWTGWTQHN